MIMISMTIMMVMTIVTTTAVTTAMIKIILVLLVMIIIIMNVVIIMTLKGPIRGLLTHRLVALVVRRPPRERKIPGSNPACDGIFSGSSHTSDSKIGTPVATLPGAWR